uniref:ATP-dependent helicase Rep n=1 Tax=Cruciviridae sp. TaxID=1955495 RepID=A0A1S6LVN1_9VIRU|nr:replication protein [Cruciviridae sp.]
MTWHTWNHYCSEHDLMEAVPAESTNGQAKHWCFTLNHPTDLDRAQVTALQPVADYYIFGEEIGENGNPHLQGFVSFKKKCRFATVKKLLPRAHLQTKRGTVSQAVAYCKKGAQPHAEWKELGPNGPTYGHGAVVVEWGDVPEEQGVAGGRKNAERWKETKDLAVAGNLDSIEPEIFIRHYATLKRIKADSRPIPPDLNWPAGSPPNEWIWGVTGCGKSRAARQENPGCYLKMNNKWWENYEDEDVVLIEDVGKSHEWMGDFLKIWADRYGFRAEIKHLSVVLRPKRIIVTSNYHPSDIWPDMNVVDPLLRRFKIRRMLLPPDVAPTAAPYNGGFILDDEDATQQMEEIVVPPPPSKKRKLAASNYLVKKPLYRQNAQGNLVPWTDTQKKLAWKARVDEIDIDEDSEEDLSEDSETSSDCE